MAKWHRRLAMLLVGTGFALVVTGPASAALTPRLSVSTSAAGSAIGYSQAPGDDPVAKLTFYVPSGFAALLAQPEGEQVGTVVATATAADLGNATLPLRGTMVAAAATTTLTVGGQSLPMSALATQCTGTATHAAFWILNLTASYQIDEPGADVQTASMPDLAPPGELGDDSWSEIFERRVAPRQRGEVWAWARLAKPIGDDPALQACALAYISDLATGFGRMRLPGVGNSGPSLDHALWFHEPIRADEWVLLQLWPWKATPSRGLYRGALRDREHRLGGTVAQEHLLRE